MKRLHVSRKQLAQKLLHWTNRYVDTMLRNDDIGKNLDSFTVEAALEFSGAEAILLLEAYGRTRHQSPSLSSLPPRATVTMALRKSPKGPEKLQGWNHAVLEWEWQEKPDSSPDSGSEYLHYHKSKLNPTEGKNNRASSDSRELAWIVDYRTLMSNEPLPEPLLCPGLWLIPLSTISSSPRWLALGGSRRQIEKRLPLLIEFIQNYLDHEGTSRHTAGLSQVYRQAIENSRDAQVLLVKGHIHYLNQRFETLTGFKREKLLGKPLQVVILSEDLLEVQEHIIDPPHESSSHYFEARIFRQDGSQLHVGFSMVAVSYQSESAWMVTIRDVSSRVNLEQSLIDKSAQQELIIEELVESRNTLNLLTEDLQAKLNNDQEKLYLTENIVNGISDWIRVIDSDLTVTYQNQSMRQVMGNLIGKKCYQSLGYSSRCTNCPVDAVFETGTVKRSEIAIGINTFSVFYAPLLEPEGSVKAIVELFQDISELKQLEESILEKSEILEAVNESVLALNQNLERATGELADKNSQLEQLNEELKTLDQLKDNFVSTVSHELRAPLTSIKGSVGLILDGMVGEVDPKVTQYLTVCQRNADRLIHLINDLLDLSKIESGRMVINPTRCILKELANEAVEDLSAYTTNRQVDLRVEIPDNLEAEVDRDRFIQVFQNLLSNSLKFTESGKVVIRAKRTRQALQVEIQDTGIGIPPDYIEKIFSKFSQVDSTLTRKVGGSGLGLAICRAIVEEHGGSISVESKLGEGSCFRIILPDKTDESHNGHPARDVTSEEHTEVEVSENCRE